MAVSPPCPPLPSTSLSTTGTTAASSWPRAPLKTGEFSNESRIPMVRPSTDIGTNFGFGTLDAQRQFRIESVFQAIRQPAAAAGISASHRLELVDDEGFG